MEKIYEENGYQKKPQKLNFSIVLSFVVALFAIVSLIAVGFNQISYAVPAETETVHYGMFGSTPAAIRGIAADDSVLYVPMMFLDSDNPDTATRPTFCIQQGIDASNEEDAYSSEGEIIDDLGLVYILNKSAVMGGEGIIPKTRTYPNTETQLSDEDYKYLETYATQVAIWMYLYSNPAYNGTAYHGKLEEGDLVNNVIHQSVNVYSTKNGSVSLYSGNIYNAYIASVVNEASSATNYKTATASLASKNISVVNDSDTYQTDKISVVATPADDLVNYTVDLYGLDGAYIVDANGKEVDAYHEFGPSDYFYIRVPINKVTKDASKVTLSISAQFKNYQGGEYFVASGAQSVIAVTHENFRTYNWSEINFMVSPDTGMTTAQTIYFIGLIVLLCGVGIIYANAKPVEEK